jgi:hypothetical protein
MEKARMLKKNNRPYQKRRSMRASAVKQRLASKARKAFAIFLKEKSFVAKGASMLQGKPI